MNQLAERFWSDEQGATAVEYGIMVALIAVTIIAVVATVGGKLNNTFNNAALHGTFQG